MDDLESEFNLKVVLLSFKQCLNEKEEVLLDHYLASWRGLVRCVRGPFLAMRPTCATCVPPALVGTCWPGAGRLSSLAAQKVGGALPRTPS